MRHQIFWCVRIAAPIQKNKKKLFNNNVLCNVMSCHVSHVCFYMSHASCHLSHVTNANCHSHGPSHCLLPHYLQQNDLWSHTNLHFLRPILANSETNVISYILCKKYFVISLFFLRPLSIGCIVCGTMYLFSNVLLLKGPSPKLQSVLGSFKFCKRCMISWYLLQGAK